MQKNKAIFSWKKLVFKVCFFLGLLVIQQGSIFTSLFLIYNDDFLYVSILHYLYCLPVMVIGSLFLFDYFKLSSFNRKPIQTILYDSFKFVTLLFGITCVFAYLLNLYALSRYALVLGAVFFYVLLTLWILINQKISVRLYKKVSLLIISENKKDALKILAKIKCEEKKLNLNIVGWLSPADVLNQHEKFLKASEILISSVVDDKCKFEILLLCSRQNKLVYVVPSFYDLSFSKYRIVSFYDTPTFQIENSGLSFQQSVLKRIFDVVFSSVILVLTSPLMLLISILIKLDSKGPVFYTQDRITNNSKVYTVFKFRTMVSDAEKLYGAYQSTGDDPRVTRLGRLLRNTHLDELPQFVNVLAGSMSVVGPRSDRTITIELMEKMAIGYDYRLKVKAGITGMAQLFGMYNSDPEDKLRYDVYYIKNYSMLLDVQLVLLTVMAMVPRLNKARMESGSEYFIND